MYHNAFASLRDLVPDPISVGPSPAALQGQDAQRSVGVCGSPHRQDGTFHWEVDWLARGRPAEDLCVPAALFHLDFTLHQHEDGILTNGKVLCEGLFEQVVGCLHVTGF